MAAVLVAGLLRLPEAQGSGLLQQQAAAGGLPRPAAAACSRQGEVLLSLCASRGSPAALLLPCSEVLGVALAGEVPGLLRQADTPAGGRDGGGSSAWDGDSGSDGSTNSFLSSSGSGGSNAGGEGSQAGCASGAPAACQPAVANLVVVGCQLDEQRLLQLFSGCCTGRVLASSC
jgi:hypothetical protein